MNAGKRERPNRIGAVALWPCAVFFVPGVPFVGFVLGLVAIKRRRTDAAIIATALGGMLTLLQVLLIWPYVSGLYINREYARVGEPLDRLTAAAVSYASKHGALAPGSTDWVPDHRAREPWSRPPWSLIGFRPAALDPSVQLRYSCRDRDGVIEARRDCGNGRHMVARYRVSFDREYGWATAGPIIDGEVGCR